MLFSDKDQSKKGKYYEKDHVGNTYECLLPIRV